jgi:hypothetical protein
MEALAGFDNSDSDSHHHGIMDIERISHPRPDMGDGVRNIL